MPSRPPFLRLGIALCFSVALLAMIIPTAMRNTRSFFVSSVSRHDARVEQAIAKSIDAWSTSENTARLEGTSTGSRLLDQIDSGWNRWYKRSTGWYDDTGEDAQIEIRQEDKANILLF